MHWYTATTRTMCVCVFACAKHHKGLDHAHTVHPTSRAVNHHEAFCRKPSTPPIYENEHPCVKTHLTLIIPNQAKAVVEPMYLIVPNTQLE